MTFDSASSAAAAADARPEGQSWPAAAGLQDEDAEVRALAALLADPSAVSSEEPESADLTAASLGETEAAAAPSSPGAVASEAPAPAVADPLAGAAASDDAQDTHAAAAPERPEDSAEEDVLPLVIALPPPSDRPAADAEADAGDDHEGAGDADRPDVIVLPDRSGETEADSQPHFDDALLQDIADAPSVSSDQGSAPGDTAWLAERGALVRKAVDLLSESSMPASAVPTDEAVTPAPDDGPAEGPAQESADDAATSSPAPGEPGDMVPEDIAGAASAASNEAGQPAGMSGSSDLDEAPAAAASADFDEALLQDITDAPAVTSDEFDLSAPAEAPPADDTQPAPIDDAPLDLIDDVPPAPATETAFDGTILNDVEDVDTTSEVSDVPAEAVFDDLPLGALPPGPAAALAFATDPDTELALRDGLFGYEGTASDCGDPQVWQGGLRAAVAALSEGHSAQLIFVDVDGIPFPAGAIHELAAVCEVGTIVVAIGSDDTARPGRELLLAGVTDYLAKPLTAEMVRAVAARAAPDAADDRPGGCVAGFIGSGGSGTTTLMTAAALQAAARGCYVSVLDLNRSVAAAALALGVEPAAGLDQLLEAAGRATPDPDMVEGVCVRRSDRVELYAHRWSPTPPPAPTPAAVESLLAALRIRSHLVLVDGFDEPALSLSPPVEIDRQVFVAEPTAGKAFHAACMIDLLGEAPPLLFVQNHTRAFKRGAGARVLQDAGLEIEPDVVIPFEPSLPELADWGWPSARLPRSLRKPVAALTDRLLDPSPGVGAAASIQLPRGS